MSAKGGADRAVADYTAALGIDPNDAAAYYNRALARQRLGNIDSAIADGDRAIALDPTAAAYNNRGSALQAKGDYAKAIADLDRAIALDPRAAGPYINRGNTKRATLDLTGAVADYTKAIALSPNSRPPITTVPGRIFSPATMPQPLPTVTGPSLLTRTPPARFSPAGSCANDLRTRTAPRPTSARRLRSRQRSNSQPRPCSGCKPDLPNWPQTGPAQTGPATDRINSK